MSELWFTGTPVLDDVLKGRRRYEMKYKWFRVTPKRRPCRLQTVQTMQTVQTVQTEYFFFLTLDWLSHFFRFYSYKIVSRCLLFILSTSNCWFNRQTRLKHFVWEIPFTDPKYTKIKHKIKLPHILGANCVNFLLVFAFAFGLVLVTLISVHLYLGVFVMHGRASSESDCWCVIGSAIQLVQNILK